MIKLKNFLLSLTFSCVFTVVLVTGSAQAKDCGKVTISEMNWASSAIVTAVAKFLMEEGYGCSVTKVPLAGTVPALVSAAETGKPDILTELWVSGTPSYHKLKDSGKIKALTAVLSDGGVEGWWIPQYTIDAHPELATLAGVVANPGALNNEFNQSPEGWYSKTINNNLMKAVGLKAAGFKVFDHGSGETLAASIAAAYANKEPWIGYYWAPTSILGKYPMVQVDLGEHIDEIHTCNQKPDCATPKVSSYPRGEVLTVTTTEFASKNVEVTKLMKNLSFTNNKMGGLLAWQEDNNASPDEAAVYFLQNNSDIWSGWLNKDARKKLKKLIK